MIYLTQNHEDFDHDLRTMLQAFYPGERIVLTEEGTWLWLDATLSETETVLRLYERDADWKLVNEQTALCDYRQKAEARNPIKGGAYLLLSSHTGIRLPWGGMTGVRPTKFATARLEQGWDKEEIIREYETVYYTTRQKGEISYEVAAKEAELFRSFHFEEEYCLYIGIPFCRTRCLYCSFASNPVKGFADRIEPYLQALFQEMAYAAEAYKGQRLVAVYIGGGTPTALSSDDLARVIEEAKKRFDWQYVREFTVEAGRPDTIDEEKMRMLRAKGVTRISINPQTMRDETLRYIGRDHTAAQIVEAFATARACGHDNINMDMIVGLPGETLEDVRYTLSEIAKLDPESVTVHSLAIKRAADLNIHLEEHRDRIQKISNDCMLAADEVLRGLQMHPYYLYRQKNIPGNLENVGYAKDGRECLYNVLIMEEKLDILALGAGTSTKLVFPDRNRIERVENVKNLDQYIDRVGEMIRRKHEGVSEKSWYDRDVARDWL